MNARIQSRTLAAFLGLLIALTGCRDGDRSATANEAPASQGLCVASDCGEAIPLVTIPDAENILFLDDGRLIVSGGRNVYEITGSLAAGFEARPLSAQDCGFTGLAARYGHLYAVCGESRLFVAPLDAALALAPVFEFADACIPNGTVFGPDGHLYVVDEPLNPACGDELPKIMRLRIDPAQPTVVQAQETWLAGSTLGGLAFGTDTVMRFPTGLAIEGNRFWATDGGSVFYVDWQPDGQAGEIVPVFFEPTAHDDLSITDGTLLVTDFFGGRILQLATDGRVLQATAEASFASPSAVMRGQPPLFSSDDILVTEKGVLQDPDGPVGNLLTLFRRLPQE